MKRQLITYFFVIVTALSCSEKAPNSNTRPNVEQSVDLGLSVEWAGWNIGASSPSECGDYFAWGETECKDIYHWDNYIFMNDYTGNYDLPYNNICGTKYDAAKVKWGNEWRMPTINEVQELIDKCSWEYGEYNGQNGYYVTGPNGNSIFIPSAGYHWYIDNELQDKGNWGLYWIGEQNNEQGYHIIFCNEYVEVSQNHPIYLGHPIRAVKTK